MHLNLIHTLRRALATAALAMIAGAAAASPQYHVTLNTAGYTGAGRLDLQFNPGLDRSPARAVLSHFDGLLDSAALDVQGGVTGTLPGTLTFDNSTAFNDVFQSVELGGLFSFDLEFTGTSSVFAVGLYGSDGETALGDGDPLTNSLVAFELGQDPFVADTARVVVSDVVEVPEPGTAWLAGAAFLALAGVRRRR